MLIPTYKLPKMPLISRRSSSGDSLIVGTAVTTWTTRVLKALLTVKYDKLERYINLSYSGNVRRIELD